MDLNKKTVAGVRVAVLAAMVACVGFIVGGVGAKELEVEVEKGVDLAKYVGLWYEIARMPSFFEPRNGFNTTAMYTLNENNGTISVVNKVFTSETSYSTVSGYGYKADKSTDEAKFKVVLKVPPQFPIIPVTGNYWILLVDKEEYQWSLVGEPLRLSLWILSRSPSISDSLYSDLTEYAKSQGYNVAKLLNTTQTTASESAVA